jgi:hypothetical protein
VRTVHKILSTFIIPVLFISQIGCANKVLTTPLNRAQFDPNYTYNIHAAQNTELPSVPGASIQNLPDRIHITQNNQTKYLLHNQIQSIDGESNQAINTHALRGLGIGAGAGAIIGAALNASAGYNNDCAGDEGEDFCGRGIYAIFGSILGAVGGGVLGLGVGAMIPQKQKVQIIPYFSPTAQNVSGGANVQVNF